MEEVALNLSLKCLGMLRRVEGHSNKGENTEPLYYILID